MARIDSQMWLLGLLLSAFACGLAVPPAVHADTLVLRNGARFEGKVLKETPDRVTLQMRFGTRDFQRSQVKEIIKGTAPAPPPPEPKREPRPKPGRPGRGKLAPPLPGPKTPERASSRSRSGPTLGTITVEQKVGDFKKTYTLQIKDAIATYYKSHMIEVSFLPFTLSSEELRRQREGSGTQIFSLVSAESSPDPEQWSKRCPYAFIKLTFEKGKTPSRDSLSGCRSCFYQLVYSSESTGDTRTDAAARKDVPKLNLSLTGKEGTLDITYRGRLTRKREISRPAQSHNYSWQISAKCKVFVK